ncbi:MAG: hypothetical protein EG828_05000 [Deltaproteobacteria bacterium]|nr:hypothetical protein [Deltaproteobacteria bacterium]
MTTRNLRLAGFLAMASAVLSIPLLLLSHHFYQNDAQGYTLFLTLIQLVGLFLFIYLNSFLKKFLNLRFAFHETDNYIDFLITITVFLTLASIGALYLPTLAEPLELFSLLLLVSFGVGQLLFGIKLFSVPDSLQGMLKPFCLFAILTGLLIATLILLPLASLTGALADVMLGTIFFRAGRKPEERDVN